MRQMINSINLFIVITLLHVTGVYGSAEIDWLTNYEEAITRSETSSKPIIMLFTGSDWCKWCIKLEKEVLSSNEFINESANKFHFLKVDFPMYTSLSPEQTEHNKRLKEKFNISSYPTIVVLDEKQQQITSLGYQPGGGSKYAHYLIGMVEDYKQYKMDLKHVGEASNTSKELKLLYKKARELGQKDDLSNIMDAGLAIDHNTFFLKEKYRKLVEEGLIHNSNTMEIRKKLLASDPNNQNKIHLDVAVIEFQRLSEDLETKEFSPEKAIAPLVNYIAKFGPNDRENLWRLQMTISQIYLSKKDLTNALSYARSSWASAPEERKEGIRASIENIEKQMDKITR